MEAEAEGPGSDDSMADGWEEEGSAVRKEGSKSRVLSSVRGTFSARRFCQKRRESPVSV